jgi:CheY-like chemotaxis protein
MSKPDGKGIRTRERREGGGVAKKILMIDDDIVIIRYLKALLEDNGYETCTAADSATALVAARDQKPDLITLDLEMPGEWGPRFYRKLRRDNDLGKIPIIVISGIDGDHAIKEAVAFMAKPFDPDRLLGIIKKTIG